MEKGARAYTRPAQAVHWTSALLILTMAPLGIVMTRIGPGATQQSLYQVHVTVGLMVLALTAFRLVWLVFHRWPPPPPGLSPLRERAFTGTHILLYLVLSATVATGAGMLLLSGLPLSPVGLSPADIQDVPTREPHHLLAFIFTALLIVHVVGVVDYQLRKGDVLSRMGIGWFSRRSQ